MMGHGIENFLPTKGFSMTFKVEFIRTDLVDLMPLTLVMGQLSISPARQQSRLRLKL